MAKATNEGGGAQPIFDRLEPLERGLIVTGRIRAGMMMSELMRSFTEALVLDRETDAYKEAARQLTEPATAFLRVGQIQMLNEFHGVQENMNGWVSRQLGAPELARAEECRLTGFLQSGILAATVAQELVRLAMQDLEKSGGGGQVLGALRRVSLPREDAWELFSRLLEEFSTTKGDRDGDEG